MKNILVSGNINLETNVSIDHFPIDYFPVCYPFFGVQTNVGGVAYNVSKALSTLGNNVSLVSMAGNDWESKQILFTLLENGINSTRVSTCLTETPRSVILHAKDGRRQVYSDLKDLQNATYSFDSLDLDLFDLVVACNVNFNRPLLLKAVENYKTIATDVHVLSNPRDEYNRDFLHYSDIIFLSDEGISGSKFDFIQALKYLYPAKIIVIGLGKNGAMLYNREDDSVYVLSAVHNNNVVNTLGAGDALFSSFLHFYTKNFHPIEALKRAEIFASKKISFNGASNGFITNNEVEMLYTSTSISVEKLNY